MKNSNLLHSGSIVLCACLVLLSCKKQILETVPEQSIIAEQAASVNECKPAVLGVYSSYLSSPGSGDWLNLAQKWYVDGKVKYLKAMHGGMTGTFLDPILDFMFVLNWGEVSYQGNQVNLKDVFDNRLNMRVTLDNGGRPVASYYDYETSPTSYMHDTSYYYYNGDRLDYIISLYKITYGGPSPTFAWRKYVFSYDNWGNIIKAEFPGNTRLTVQYDYTKPVRGMMSNFHVTSSLKLLEYLDLIKLPMNHAVTRTNFAVFEGGYPPNEYFYEMRNSQYKDYVIIDGLVKSYVYDDPFPFKRTIFYNGWECDASPSMNVNNKPENAIANLKQFQQLYPNKP
jgi:hypothetical protein